MQDFNHLKPGDYLDAIECGTIFGEELKGEPDVLIPMPPEDPRYPLRLLALRQRIEGIRPDLVLRCRQHGLTVLTDAEKVGFSESVRDAGIRKQARAVQINQRTNAADFTPEQQAAHAHATLRNAATYQGAKRALAPARKAALELLADVPAPKLAPARKAC
jgi:hypothetical protein